MKLEFNKLTLENYRYYYGHQELMFSTLPNKTTLPNKNTHPNKNIVVVKGDNGAGKSNILNALTWCLYNDEMHRDKKNVGLPILNTQYIAEIADTGREGEASVTLTVTVDGEMWEIKRSIRGYGEKDPHWTKAEPKYRFTNPREELVLTYPDMGDYKVETDAVAQQRILGLLPYDLRSFFFIDGEQLREFFKKDTSTKMQDAIEKLSQLDYLKDTNKSLNQYRKYLRKELQDTNPEMERIQSELSDIEINLSTVKQLIEKKKKEVAELEREKEEIDSYLESYNVTSIRQTHIEIKRLETAIEEETNNLKKARNKKNAFLVENAPRIYLSQTIKKAHVIINQLITKGDLPPKIKSSFIQELIENGRCICGHEIGEEEREMLMEYAERVEISELTSVAFEGKAELENHIELIKQFPDKLDEFNSEIETYEYNIDQYTLQLDAKKSELAGYNIDEINEKSARKDLISQEIGQLKLKISAAENKSADLRSKEKELKQEEKNEMEKSKLHSAQTEKLKLVNDTIEVVEKVIDGVKEKIRISLEENTKIHFLDFLREEGLFRDLKINDLYEVQVINNEGWDNREDLSAGQYLILGYAFVVALRTITGYDAPVIVDTPLGKLDTIHQDKITKYLPKLLNNSQLTFLVTSSEYSETVRRNLSEYMSSNSYYEIQKCPKITSARLVHGK